MLEDIDLCLLDVKSGDEETYHKVTGGTLQPTIDFGQRLAKAGKKIWVRFVLVPGLTDSEENVENVAKICESFGDAVEHIDVLGFHQLGRPKWHELRIPYPLENQKGPNAATRERVANQFKDHASPCIKLQGRTARKYHDSARSPILEIWPTSTHFLRESPTTDAPCALRVCRMKYGQPSNPSAP